MGFNSIMALFPWGFECWLSYLYNMGLTWEALPTKDHGCIFFSYTFIICFSVPNFVIIIIIIGDASILS